MMTKLRLMAFLLLSSFAFPQAALAAGEIFLNGVRVTGLKNQKFTKCAVRFDAKGDVHITAPGFTVKRVGDGSAKAKGSGAAARTAPAPSPRKQVFLFSQSSRPGYAQYDVDVYLNGKWVRKIRGSEPQVVMEITPRMKAGRNVVQFAATKNYRGKPRLSTAKSDYVQVIVGVGTKGGATVQISDTLASFKTTAATDKNFGQEQSVVIK